jgi:hypothetical protein
VKPVSRVSLIIFIIVAILFWIHAIVSESGFLLLDHINLPFHEFGHIFFGILGERIAIWGGTISQLAVPFILLVCFWIKKEPLGIAFCAFWFGENLLNISVYIADAQIMALPLVGGGEHDWNTILSGLSMLQYTATIAKTVKIFGWLIMIAAVLWLTFVALFVQSEEE